MNKLYPIVPLFIIFFISACQQSESPYDYIDSQLIIASYDTGNVTLKELDDYIVNLPPHQRWEVHESDKWLKKKISNLITEKKLLEEATLIAADEEPIYQNLVHNLTRLAYAQQYLASFPNNKIITEEDYLNFYNDNINRYQLSEKRYVHHIYKDNTKNTNAKQEIDSLRVRAINGENFKLLAEQFSDSETRHNKGFLGILKKGDKSHDFDSVVFSLIKNEVSKVITTATGFHLFYVSDILKAKDYQYSQVQNLIKKELQEKHSMNNLKQKAMLLPVPTPFITNTFKSLSEVNLRTNPRKIILEIGNYQLTISQFMHELEEIIKASKVKPSKAFSENFLQSITYTEIIYQHMIANNIELNQQTQLNTKKNKLLISEFTNKKMHSYLNKNSHLINDYFEKNKMRFASPVKVKLQRLIVKKTDENLMPKLEASIELLDNQKLEFEQLTKNINGIIQNLGWNNAAQLSTIDPQILNYAFILEKGEYSPPYTNEKFYSVLKLIDRKDPIEQTLVVVRNQVISEYIKINSAQLYFEISKDLIKNVSFNDEVLQSFISNKGLYEK